MSSMLLTGGEHQVNAVLKSLSRSRRRRILAVLRGRPGPVGERKLARHVVAAEEGTAAAEVARDAAHDAHVELRHVHLPALAAADLVAWNDAEETVAATDHPALRLPRVARAIEAADDELDEVFSCLADDRRRAVLTVLHERDGPLKRAVLAHEVAALEGEGEPSPEEVDAVVNSLHHAHLPALRSAGLIEYDPDGKTVAYSGYAALDPAWFDVRANEESNYAEPPRSVGRSWRSIT